MKTLIRLGFLLSLLVVLSAISTAQIIDTKTTSHGIVEKLSKSFRLEPQDNESTTPQDFGNFPNSPLSSLISIPGAVPVGISGKYHTQTAHGGLHNIQVDPSDPMKIHVVIMTALNVKITDTTTASNFPQRNIYYTFSSDGGVTWKAAKKIAPFRAGFPAMILYKRNGVNVPIIGDHRYIDATTQQFISALYVEKGAPGDGNFEETAADMTTAEGDSKQILWPSIAVSSDNTKVYMVSAVNITVTSDPLYHLQFSTFLLDGQGKATWSGWKKGPAYDADNGLCTGGNYVIGVSKSGKVGIVWESYDYSNADRGIYLSESTDAGANWGAPINVYAPVASTDANNQGSNLDVIDEDFFYSADEKANIVMGAQYELGTQTNNTYIPASGALLFWKTGMTVPVYILSREIDNSLGSPLLDGSWLSVWTNNLGIDPQGPNVENPTLARGSDDSKFSIYFQAWAQDDTGTYLLPPPFVAADGSDTSIKYPFHGIYRVDTHDGGKTFGDIVPVRTNTITDPQEKKRDYRFPEVSTFNPENSTGYQFAFMFGADSLAGISAPTNPGLPGYDDIQWFYESNLRNGVQISGANSALNLNQNFPNPFISATTIPLAMKSEDMVTLSVSDILGREVAMLFHGRLSLGEHRIPFNAHNLGAGIYTYTLKTSMGSVSRTMSLIK